MAVGRRPFRSSIGDDRFLVMGDQAPLVLIYTAAGSWGQCLASTTDGRTITKYAKNPVLQQITTATDPLTTACS